MPSVELDVLYQKTPKKAILKHQQCNSRANFIRDLLLFGKGIKVFLNER